MKKYRFTSIGVSALLATLVFVFSLVGSSAAYYGDVDRNGKVNSSDARTILRHSAKLAVITDEEILKIADITGDGRVNSSDARAALRMAGKLDPLKEIPSESGLTTEPQQTVPTLPDAPTTVEPTTAEPTTAEPTTVEPTTAEPTTAEPTTVEPTTAEPTTAEPTTAEPTTVEPTTAEPTTLPAEPTTQPEEATTQPIEPTTQPVEPTTQPVEPTTQPAVDPRDKMTVNENYYIDAVMFEYHPDGSAGMEVIKVASNTKQEKGALGIKTYDLTSYYVRSSTAIPGSDIGIIMQDKLNFLKTGTEKTMYIINYATNEYMEITIDATFQALGFDVDELMADMKTDSLSIATFSDLDGLAVVKREYEGTEYDTVDIDGGDGTVSRYYLHKAEGKDYYEPAVIESYVGDRLDSSMTIIAFEPNPGSGYFTPPSSMTHLKFNVVDAIRDERVLAFFEHLGM